MSDVIHRVRRALANTDVRATGVTLDKADVHDLLRLAKEGVRRLRDFPANPPSPMEDDE